MIAKQALCRGFDRFQDGRNRLPGDVSHEHDTTTTMRGDEAPTEAQTVAPLGHMDALPPGTMLGEFEVQGLLGVGGFGMVYRCYDHSLHRAVAIKEYMPSSLVGRAVSLQVSARSTADTQSFMTGLASFMAEARLLAQFDHPSLVKVYRVWEENNTAYMVMPLYSGMTLKQARAQMSGPPPEDWLRAVIWSVLEALKVLHANGTLHRDVSPDNIFLQDIGSPVLLDLGAARHALADSSRKHTAILKVNYAPIEQYADAHELKEGPWTDLYALAAVVHGCLCNEAPLPATFRVVRDRMPSIASVVKTVDAHFGQSYSSAFVRAIDHALAIQPTKRTKDAETFARELRLRTPKRMASFDWRERLGDAVTLGGATDGPSSQAHLPTRPVASIGDAWPIRWPNGGAARLAHATTWLRRHAISVGLILLGTLLLAVAIDGGLHSGLPAVRSEASAQLASPAQVPAPVLVPDIRLPQESPSVPAPVGLAPAPLRANTVESKSGHRSAVRDNKGTVSSSKAVSMAEKPTSAAVEGAVLSPTQAERQEICAGANVFTRSMCVYRECQKPENAELPVCVEDRKRWDSRNRERLP